jgi:hypothetical protein
VPSDRTDASGDILSVCGGGEGLLEVGGRELAMRTRDNGVSCLYISGQEGHLDVVKARCWRPGGA